MGVSNQFQLTQNACFDELIPNGGDELIPIGVDELIPMDVSVLFSPSNLSAVYRIVERLRDCVEIVPLNKEIKKLQKVSIYRPCKKYTFCKVCI
jgi:hypothetical protein